MSFLTRRILRPRRVLSPHTRIAKRHNTTSASQVSPTFTQQPPIWVRFAWPLIIANALFMGSAVDITWNHWATLVKDLEAVAEKNKQTVEATQGTTSQNTDTSDKEKETPHWERRPTWQRAVFCGIYATGWALSTVYLLKYRQTFVTGLRFFRGPKEILSAPAAGAAMTPEVVSAEKPVLRRLVHITTASDSKGRTLPLSGLVIQDGRNETEMVIRMGEIQGTGILRRREYWYLSLTDAIVDGARYGGEDARERLLGAWDGTALAEKRARLRRGWKSGPAISQS